ncbi:MAG: hypothetical protein R3E96_03075 [Planctomycetota bacterium]
MAELVAAGSANLESNDLILRAYAAAAVVRVLWALPSPRPADSAREPGVICLTNSSIGRFNALDEIWFSGTTGSFAFAPDWSSIGDPNGATHKDGGADVVLPGVAPGSGQFELFRNGVSVTCE